MWIVNALVFAVGVKSQVNLKKRRIKMSKIKFIVLGYFLAMCIHGCDLGITSPNEDFEVSSSGLGTSPNNPVYVKIVEY